MLYSSHLVHKSFPRRKKQTTLYGDGEGSGDDGEGGGGIAGGLEVGSDILPGRRGKEAAGNSVMKGVEMMAEKVKEGAEEKKVLLLVKNVEMSNGIEQRQGLSSWQGEDGIGGSSGGGRGGVGQMVEERAMAGGERKNWAEA